jgi:hypothetical protein
MHQDAGVYALFPHLEVLVTPNSLKSHEGKIGFSTLFSG